MGKKFQWKQYIKHMSVARELSNNDILGYRISPL
jgi:hypothetical protein